MDQRLALYQQIMEAGPLLALGMLHKLSVHIDKGPWHEVPLDRMVNKYWEEVYEFQKAVDSGDWGKVLDEAADVANMVMMIVHKLRPTREELPIVRT